MAVLIPRITGEILSKIEKNITCNQDEIGVFKIYFGDERFDLLNKLMLVKSTIIDAPGKIQEYDDEISSCRARIQKLQHEFKNYDKPTNTSQAYRDLRFIENEISLLLKNIDTLDGCIKMEERLLLLLPVEYEEIIQKVKDAFDCDETVDVLLHGGQNN
jgi:uncharacterized coiled-coil DUF342 family protein